ncbi:MAG TPA: PhzF family phenazine biosynthesis protein [Nitrospira sp.]|jgi:trans-2,3-dihydro-3-hydroxyanthranilate isomerase|nr:PhzF family phenazine biosynthesis protein [Nitrospira sp.]MBS0163180.1 PhzF family phenazine biosynthesis protein [Nitrospira sp.]MBS0175781.1 PhzF family phenazine biosynthesis protein [Nitrospira sp.]MBS0178751.1 PhzF family phenazine biosynthesis protein [Nitrospira sp.]MBX3338009.1 PhzF family phenazine biosynthesis protein [Nitrospira sp.]
MPGQRRLQFYQADVFTDEPFGGNPVAVFPDADGLTDEELQRIAREMNLSETVFVFPPTDPAAVVKVRIFTPTQEIPFAGHPVIGTFFVLGSLGRLTLREPVTRVLQECNLGLFPVDIHSHDGVIERVVMAQPSPEFLDVIDEPEALFAIARSLGITKSAITESRFPVQVVSTGLPVIIVPVRTLTAVRSIVPDVAAIAELSQQYGANGMMVFSTMTVEQSSSVHTRMFAPLIGIVEDPATGSASGALGAYLVQHGVVDIRPETEITAEQGYEIDRPSRILIQVNSDDDAIQGVMVGGESILVVEGTLSC